jgi:molybdenum cofactor cytidylyltransferase
MRTETVQVNHALGKLLCHPIFHRTGRKLLAKGHLLCEEDLRLLDTEGHAQVCVAVLEEGEIPEEEAALRIARESACGSLEVRMGAGGRANLVTTESCCLLLDEVTLRSLNQVGGVTMATMPNFAYAVSEQRVATVMTAPFAVPTSSYERAAQLLSAQGPLLQARPIRQPTVAVLYTDPLRAERAKKLFEGIMKTRLDRLSVASSFVLCAVEEESAVARGLDHLLRARPHVVLVASTTAPAGPEDVVGRAMRRVGCRIESFLAPVEPGNLLLLAYAGQTPLVSAPGCFRSPRPNAVDLVLPPLLARYPLSANEVSSLGHGGLLL